MKISFDLDGTLFTYPNQLVNFGWFMQERGHQVGLLTGRGILDLEQNILPMLAREGFVPNFYIGRDFEPIDPNWDRDIKNQEWKPKMIKDHNIDIHFDDQIEGDIGINHGGGKIIKV